MLNSKNNEKYPNTEVVMSAKNNGQNQESLSTAITKCILNSEDRNHIAGAYFSNRLALRIHYKHSVYVSATD